MCRYMIIFVFLSLCSSTAWSSYCDSHPGRYHVESISSRNLTFGYSPFYDKKTNSFFFIDSNNISPYLFRYDLNSKQLYGASIDAGYSIPSFLFPIKGKKNQFVYGTDRTLMILDWDGVSPTAKYIRNATSVEQDPIYDGKTRLDSGKVDPKGRLYAGTYSRDFCLPSTNPNGSLYLFEKNKNVQTLVSDLKSLSGLVFNKKEKLAYTLDYCTNYISEYDWSPRTGRLSNWRKVFTFPALLNQNYIAGGGMDIDSCGNLYVGLYNASQILQINPRSGVAERVIHLPVETITALAFGGPHLDVMIVLGTTDVQDPFNPLAVGYPAPSPWRGQPLIVTGLGVKGACAGTRVANYL